jgi:hypothetical protein
MATDWEATFRNWSKPSSDFEQQKMDNAVAQVRAAVDKSPVLGLYDIYVFPQGSYRNNTNVRQESDVDVCVLNRDVQFSDFSFANGLTRETASLSSHPYKYDAFKDDVETALVGYFGRTAVKRGKKAFDISESTTRVEADVVAAYTHRRYTGNPGHGTPPSITGTEFVTDTGQRIINWPEQHHANGGAKNLRTSNRFKFMVRVLKRLRYYMEAEGVAAAKGIPSYLIECLVWNARDAAFEPSAYWSDMREVLRQTFNGTRSDDLCQEWREVSDLKYLFRQSQAWTRPQAHAFLSAAWDFVGFT